MGTEKVPATYVGPYEVRLSTFGRPYYDGNGKILSSLLLHYGDTLMINPDEAYGKTQYRPQGSDQPQELGFGRVVLEEHKQYSDAELVDLGYIFHQPRTDFQAMLSIPNPFPAPKPTGDTSPIPSLLGVQMVSVQDAQVQPENPGDQAQSEGGAN